MNEVVVGYLCCLVSVVGFGSNYIPVKRVDVKDGVFFTLCMSIGIFLTGLIQWIFYDFYKFEPFAMLGGAIWAVGNACVPFIIQRCGLGAGQLIWSVTNMGTGWATGTFGLFGKDKDYVQYFALNCVGVVLAVASLAPFALMKSSDDDKTATASQAANAQDDLLLMPSPTTGSDQPGPETSRNQGSSIDFAMGFALALVAGVFMGSNFDPPTYLQQIGPPEHSADAMCYVISHFAGIVLASLVYFIGYLAMRGSAAFYQKEVIMPGVLSGIMWGIAQIGWFKANTVLSYVIAFPIIVATPGVLASFWGVVLFGENKGQRNMSLLACVVVLQVVGVIIIAKSKGNA
eukprot:TRINITY_DN63975_c0_g1_i1.p1 TRINITY_DN63975_c0_g1~~TRINITY_DN63975_c0_g1_i1.p1  ORF type:complete len:361 (-),score=47.46 TRINITY_DN63975_c0_g1_i1:198-1232(-)